MEGGAMKTKKISKQQIEAYEQELVMLYKRYIKLARSNKTEQELEEGFQKLDKKIKELAHKIKEDMKR